MVLDVSAQDNHKKTTANGVGSLGLGQSQKDHSEWCWKAKTSNTICCGLFVIVLSQDFQRHSLWSFCDCPEPRLPTPFAVVFLAQDNHKKTTANGVGSLGLAQLQKDHSEWRWKSWLLWTITKNPLSQDFQLHSLWSFCFQRLEVRNAFNWALFLI
jgi:hypothetical protein